MVAGRPAVARQRLVNAARSLLLQRGLHVSLEDVAAEAGVTRQTIYNHFRSKEAVLRAVFDEMRGDLLADLADLVDWEGEPEVVLPAVAAALADHFFDPDIVRLRRVMIQAVEILPDLVDQTTPWRRPFFTGGPVLHQLSRYLDGQVAAGRLRIDDTELAAILFMGSVMGFPTPRLTMGGQPLVPEMRRRLVRGAADTFLAAWAGAP